MSSNIPFLLELLDDGSFDLLAGDLVTIAVDGALRHDDDVQP